MSEEIRNKAEELTDEAVEQAAGGKIDARSYEMVCPKCQHVYYGIICNNQRQKEPPCPKCGYDRFSSFSDRISVPTNL